MEKIPHSSVLNTIIANMRDLVDTDYKLVTTIIPSVQRTSTHHTSPIKSRVENRFILPKELFKAVDFTNMGVVEEPKNIAPTFIKGEKYSLKGVSCEGFEMPEKIYEVVGVHDSFDGVDINSVIVKQISGDQDKIFTLSKNDCKFMGIDYENGLQLFPKYLDWKKVKDIVPFDASNLATTPLSDIDGSIRYILLQLNGFKDYADGYIVTPSGKIIKEEQFENTLKIVSNEPIVYEVPTATTKGLSRAENTKLNIELVYPKGLTYNHGNFISSEDTIYVLIKLVEPLIDPNEFDGQGGVDKVNLEGFNPNDHFQISWDELGAYTIEEYETEKARKEKERQEKIAKEEAERKKRIAEEEKRIKEQRKRTEEAIIRMKGFKIKIPTFPRMADSDMDNGISSFNLYTDSLDAYFKSLDSSLRKLSNDLNQMERTIGINM